MGGMNLAAFTAPFQYARPVQQETPWDAAAKFGQLRALAQAQQLRQQELQNQQLEAQKTQMALDEHRALNQAYMSSLAPDETGVPQLDKTKLTQALISGGHGGLVPGVLSSVAAYEKSQAEYAEKQADLAAKQQDHGGDIGAVVKSGNYNPHLLMTLTQDSINKGTTSKARGTAIINALQQAFEQDPTGQQATQIAQQISDQLIANSPKQQGLLKTRGEITAQATTEATQQAALTEKQRDLGRQELLALPVDPNTNLPTQEAWDAWSRKYKGVYNAPPLPDAGYITAVNRSAVAPKDIADFDLKTNRAAALAKLTPADWAAKVDQIASPTSKDTADLNRRTKLLVLDAVAHQDWDKADSYLKDASDQLGRTETALRSAVATKGVKIELAGATAAARSPKLSDDALELAAAGVASGKPIPAGFSRNQVAVGQIYSRAAQMLKEQGFTGQAAVAEQNAAQANKGALNAVVKAYGTLKPFGELADKNADILEQKLKGVTDLGASFLNTPVRNLESKFGSARMAAFTAALLPLQNEFARVLNSTTGTGVLTDTARGEMEHAIKPGATVGEMKAALDVFRTEWAQRKGTLEAQIEDLKRMSVVGGAPAPQPNAGQPPAGKIRVRRKSDKQTGTIDPGDFDPAKYEKL